MNAINPLSALQSAQLGGAGLPNALESPGNLLKPAAAGVDQPSFKNLMLQALNHVNAMQQDADQAVEKLATGGDINTAEVLTSIQKADMSFRLMLQVRNKLVQAYDEVKNIQI